MSKLRPIFLGSALALTVAASVFDLPWQQPAEAQADAPDANLAETQAAGAAKGPRTAPAAADKPVAGAQPEPVRGATPAGPARMRHSQANAFASTSWLPPVPKPKPAPPPPPPRAPALPFVYLGRVQDGAAVTAFVSLAGRNHVLHSGDTVAGYRVESITPTDMTFVYLALGEKQRLSFGSEN
jgi:hypothetical protein